jgi:hypothetical protein
MGIAWFSWIDSLLAKMMMKMKKHPGRVLLYFSAGIVERYIPRKLIGAMAAAEKVNWSASLRFGRTKTTQDISLLALPAVRWDVDTWVPIVNRLVQSER